jgi:hypothetical protein
MIGTTFDPPQFSLDTTFNWTLVNDIGYEHCTVLILYALLFYQCPVFTSLLVFDIPPARESYPDYKHLLCEILCTQNTYLPVLS